MSIVEVEQKTSLLGVNRGADKAAQEEKQSSAQRELALKCEIFF